MNQEAQNLLFDIITSVGSLATFGAFIFLFRRDKDKQAQIDKLTEISTMLEAQNETMKKHNDLVSQQVDIFRNTSILKGNDQDALNKLQEIEETRLRLSVMPILSITGGSYNGSSGEFQLYLNNKGEDAILTEFINNSADVELQKLNSPYVLEKGKQRLITGRQAGDKHIQHCDQDFNVIYTDRLDNKYLTRIKGKGNNLKIESTKRL